MPIETAELIYSFAGPLLIVVAALWLWHLKRTFSRDDVFARPEALTRGQLKNTVAFARMMMKNTRSGSVRYEDAQRRHEATQAELRRRPQR